MGAGRPLSRTRDAVDGPAGRLSGGPVIRSAPRTGLWVSTGAGYASRTPRPVGELKAPADPDPRPACEHPRLCRSLREPGPAAQASAARRLRASPSALLPMPDPGKPLSVHHRAAGPALERSLVGSLQGFDSRLLPGRHASRQWMELPRRSGRSVLARSAGSPLVRRRSGPCRNAERLKAAIEMTR